MTSESGSGTPHPSTLAFEFLTLGFVGIALAVSLVVLPEVLFAFVCP